MYKKILTWIGVGLAVVVTLLIGAGGILYERGQSRFNQRYDVQTEDVAIPHDAETLERGEHLVGVLCAGCHGENLAGADFFNDASLGAIHSPNLTAGDGGIGSTYTDVDFVRTLRHGVRPTGTSVFVMPSPDYYYLSDQDLGSIIAYLRTAPPVDQGWGPKQFTVLGNMLIGAGVFDALFMANRIDHVGPRPVAPAIGVTKEYGGYLVRLNGCRQCHGQQLSGGKVDDPTLDMQAPNLTSAGALAAWSMDDFIKAMRSGTTPAGYRLNQAMPWKNYAKMSDGELQAIFLYLQSLAPLPTTVQ